MQLEKNAIVSNFHDSIGAFLFVIIFCRFMYRQHAYMIDSVMTINDNITNIPTQASITTLE